MLCCCMSSCYAGCDLGIIFDTDVDRSAVVDGDGTPINSNRFIALMAAIVLQVWRTLVKAACMREAVGEGGRDRGRGKRACNPGASFAESSFGNVCVCVADGGILSGPQGVAVVQAAAGAKTRGVTVLLCPGSVGLLQDQPGSTVVTDSVTSDGLTKFIEARGGKHLRWAAGGWGQT